MSVNKSSQLCIVERLTFVSWLTSLFPFLLRNYTGRNQTVFYIDGSAVGVFFSRLTGWCLGISIDRLSFRLIDIKDEKGDHLSLRIAYEDFARVQQWIVENPLFQSVLQNKNIVRNRMQIFLIKQTASFDYDSQFALWRALLLVHVVKWKRLCDKVENGESILFLGKRMWMREIQRYGMEYGVRVLPTQRNIQIHLKSIIERLLGYSIVLFIKHVYFYICDKGFTNTFKRFFVGNRHLPNFPEAEHGSSTAGQDAPPRIMVEYYGHLNLDNPELHSDLFFWQQSPLPGDDIVVMFKIPSDPADEKKAKELQKHHMHAVALSPKASTVDFVQYFPYWPHISRGNTLKPKTRKRHSSYDKKCIQEQIMTYHSEHAYWNDLFTTYGIKIYLSWFKFNARHCVIADALQSAGGVTAIYQRSFEEFPLTESVTASDIVFAFSPWNADIERKSGSIIPYHVAVGYFGDHRFALLHKPAQKVRERIKKNGAKHISAFFDENSLDDSRWHTGHEFMRENYAFLLEKVLSEPWLGVLFKPKTPASLRQRLGPVAGVLKRAEETGRCFVFEGGALQSTYPPAIAALAADVAIHGHLVALTAAMEAALAGTPTLLLDREGFSVSELYSLGKGKVVFTDWESLWNACNDYWRSNQSIKGFGDWSPLLDQIDPFRDGRAAERIGTYLQWLLDGFKAGLSRDTVMADAAVRYCKIWGSDKITEVCVKSGPE